VICYSDSLHIIKLIQAPPNAWHVYATIIKNINDLLNLLWNVHLTYTFREANECANFLAKHGQSQFLLVQLEVPPPSLEALVLAYASNVQFLRP